MKAVPFLATTARAACCIFLLVLTSCSKPIERADLIGKYTANHKKGLDVLDIKDDGTYIHTYQPAVGEAVTNSDHWEVAFEKGEPRITFSKFTFGFGVGSKVSGFWDVKVERSGNQLRLSIDPDLNYYYEK